MIAGFLALALVQTGQPIGPDPRLEAFKAACVPHRDDMAAAEVLLEREGWARVADDDHPELAVTMAKAREGMADPELNATHTISVWGRSFGDRRFYVMVSRLDAMIGETKDDDGDGVIQDWERATPFSQISCGLWDFDATEAVHPGAVVVWTGSLAVQTIEHEGLSGGTWNVYDMMPGTGEVHVGFIAPGSPSEALGFSGASITMSSAPKEVHAAYMAERAAEEAADAAANGPDAGSDPADP